MTIHEDCEHIAHVPVVTQKMHTTVMEDEVAKWNYNIYEHRNLICCD